MSDFENGEFFSQKWWAKVIDAWNIYEMKSQLAGFNSASFIVEDLVVPCVSINWDNDGCATILKDLDNQPLVFSATIRSWLEFISGDFSALEGVIKSKITYTGPLGAVLNYTEGFTRLAQVAKEINY